MPNASVYTARDISEISLYIALDFEEAECEITEKYNREVNITKDVDPDDIW